MIRYTNNQEQSNRIIELYMFVNPLGTRCLKAEEHALKLIESHKGKFHFRVIAFHNLQTVANYMKALNIDASKQPEISQNLYQACLAFKAAELQGKKNGRNFLITLQRDVVLNKKTFCYDLLVEVAKQTGIDVEMFLTDLHSDLVQKAFESDQKIAREMCVEKNPSAVFFDTDDTNYGILIDDCLTPDILEKVYQEIITPEHQVKRLTSSTHLPAARRIKHYLRSL
ncbi:DsbA family protein [Isobaculum melis]|uniref:Thioredoxin n=1 Tax=Isobaculum melis TaxID=142588 RepID=A0A1H9T9U4_9LACT|nr:DsbA family protein [Isobaculum melis]SER93817.1 Thioredoxin [Isobaculum melis]